MFEEKPEFNASVENGENGGEGDGLGTLLILFLIIMAALVTFFLYVM